MKFVLHFSPEVEDDAVNGYRWYESKDRGLGEDFLRMFYSTVAEIHRWPMLTPEISARYRRRLIRRFPYAIYYVIQGHEIILSGLFHCARDPEKIITILQDRSAK